MARRWWLNFGSRRHFNVHLWACDPYTRRECAAITSRGEPCKNPADNFMTAPVCGRHTAHLERIWRKDVEKAAWVLFQEWSRDALRRMSTPVGTNGDRADQDPIMGVYFVEGVHPKWGRLVKIGLAGNVRQRLRDLGNHGMLRLRLRAIEQFADYKEAQVREKELHAVFRQCRLKGEWFIPTNDVELYIAQLKEAPIA